MKNTSKIPTFIGILFLILGVGAGVFLVNRQQLFGLGASPETSPKDVRITNVTDTTFTVSWITDKNTTAFIKWGETANLGKTQEDSTGANSGHLVTLTGLSAGRQYYFKINSNGQDFDNNGAPWSTATLVAKPAGGEARVSGSVLSATGGVGGIIIYISSDTFGVQSGITSSSGNWTSTVPSGSQGKTLLNVYVQGGSLGIATAQVYLDNANPIPPMTLGQTYDFRNISGNTTGNDLTALINLPTSSSGSAQSRLDTSTKVTTTQTPTVTLTTVSEGETLFTGKPEFRGEGPKNTALTITIHSDSTIKQTVKTSASGTWSFSPQTTLSDGTHILTVTWKDATGALKTLTRNFTVLANTSEPSFVSTPSGGTPTATPIVITPAPTVAPIVTATPVPTIASTSSALPKAGDTNLTLFIFGLGVTFLLGGLLINKI